MAETTEAPEGGIIDAFPQLDEGLIPDTRPYDRIGLGIALAVLVGVVVALCGVAGALILALSNGVTGLLWFLGDSQEQKKLKAELHMAEQARDREIARYNALLALPSKHTPDGVYNIIDKLRRKHDTGETPVVAA